MIGYQLTRRDFGIVPMCRDTGIGDSMAPVSPKNLISIPLSSILYLLFPYDQDVGLGI
jgi:hypothetical protein